MIVGTKDIDLEELRRSAKDATSLINYAESLVPRVLRHHVAIVNNQKYLVALYLRNMNSIPYKRRINLCEELLAEVSVTGVINTIIDFNDILTSINIDELIDYLEVSEDVGQNEPS